ncbi:sterol 3-beta-glucosyltransferase UGT80A2 [Hirsutella rhossiliensis]|uniref:Sterol 3-beta-glucosyltransferase UGT80A2 n=1 Tax=Hirsutella rhossiliensis TaxID=111463 RepID=A0A9P8SDE9_9HYPO|nr:sterol 3-beta-glucosyltransferase UGT80A2 [Hirsutella rhossiliensis]KAH0957889.1 sterol 3-beta-glucosyltransferase UGT80A2 [Hirsutella rhossiliensis]
MEPVDDRQRPASHHQDAARGAPTMSLPAQLRIGEDGSDALVTDGFIMPHLGSPADTPPAYGAHHDHVQFSQPGFEAGAAVTTDGRVNININTKNRRLADLLTPTLDSQLSVEPQPSSALPYLPPGLGPESGTEHIPPPLNVVIQIVGSRGDIQPFVALGKVLKNDYGHRVRIATHATFQDFVLENELEFFNIGGDPAELMAFMVKHPGLMPGIDALKSGEISKRRRGIQEMLLGCWRSCIEPDETQEPFIADAIIANPPSFAHIHIAEKLGIPLHMMFTMPWSPTRAFPHPLANVQSSNADDGLGDVINRFREKALDLPPLSFIWAPGLLTRLKVPYTYCWSPTLIPKPNDWGKNIDISGFYFLNLASSFTPDPALAAFLEAGPPPVYIGFGSIVVDDPNAMTRMIFDAIHLSGVRALVSKGWGGLGADDVGLPEGVHMLGNVPHDWLFERVSCVVHHGGAGTTAAGIKAGKPTFVVPFFGDQPFWGAMIARAKAGPEPIRYKDLTAEKLAEALRICLQPGTQEQAKELGRKIRQEHGTQAGDKAAAWRVRRSMVRLSPLAVAVLVSEGLLEYTDVKLYRPYEYNTEDQPPDPISAGACSLVGDLSSIGMAIADMPRQMVRSGQRVGKESQNKPPPLLLGSTSKQSLVSADKVSKVDHDPPSPPGTSQLPLVDLSATVTSGSEDSSPLGVSVGAAVGAGRNVGRAVSTGVKSPMNFCLGLAKGFRNVPRLYNDDTIRPVEKVTDLSSGIRIAGKELGYGFFDGIAGLVTQPIRGAGKEGAGGFVKGFGKGIGGLITKPAAGIWGVPAYMMQGVHAQVSKLFTRSVQNYIMTSRAIQGQQDLGRVSIAEKGDMIRRWDDLKFDLKNFYMMKRKEKVAGKVVAAQEGQNGAPESPFSRPKTSWIHTRHLASEERKKLQAQKELLKKGYVDVPVPLTSSSGSSTRPSLSEDAEYEQAIQASVRETSRGNAEEDAMIEAAIRESVCAMRQHGGLPEPIPEDPEKNTTIFESEEFQITDEEYQALIEQAIQQSMANHMAHASLGHEDGFVELDAVSTRRSADSASAPTHYSTHEADADAELQRAIEESKKHSTPPPRSGDEGDEEELQRAIAASKEEMEREATQRTEEDIVLDFVKKQSLAEEEYRQQMGKGKGKAPEAAGKDDEEDEELRRALEESLKMQEGAASSRAPEDGNGGPSGSRAPQGHDETNHG